MSADTQSSDTVAWSRVREAITERWPHLNRDGLAECSNDTGKLSDFVKQHVNASDDEVDSVVHEFAPPESLLNRVSHAASDGLHQAAESAEFAYMRADECIAQRPTESVLASFVAGAVVGAVVTALWMSSRPAPSTWDRIRQRSWS